ncbi:MAG: hydrogenase expression protein HypE [Betaproteobacteria bacterium RIFCSPLOWO2_02_FULL_63_19]|nr:MAG: hydrogenase expression protein HypE [Betaproteobacteria bacterium RIFCSPLOWO2_02_FULL_63_19]
MTSLRDLIDQGQSVRNHRPWPRTVLGSEGWQQAAALLQQQQCALLALWADKSMVHMALLDEERGEPAILSLACEDDRFPSVGRVHAPAIRLERMVRDLSGLQPEGLPDTRAWLDHGRWPVKFPLGRVEFSPPAPLPYPFLAAEGESLHQIPVGPVHAGIIEPGHFRFTANGETVVRLEERLGYVHKGIESLIAGQTVARAAALAGRVSGDSTVAYTYAFARAVEAALDAQVPVRAIWLRALMSELERLANHFGDIGAVCNDAAFALLHAQCGLLREQVLRASERCFGHRLMMDCIVPGGVRNDLPQHAPQVLSDLVAGVRRRFPELIELFDNTASLKDRTVGTGVLAPMLARQFAPGGIVGRASGRAFDARRTPSYPPYDQLPLEVPVLEGGDVNARVWIRIQEVERSLGLIERILVALPAGPVQAELAEATKDSAAEGVAMVEGFRGDIFVWVRTEANGTIGRCHLRDPSWFQWPLLEAVIEGNIVADFPLCNKSFNCSYSGHDL